jgi:hypothetical protein
VKGSILVSSRQTDKDTTLSKLIRESILQQMTCIFKKQNQSLKTDKQDNKEQLAQPLESLQLMLQPQELVVIYKMEK